MGISDKNNLTFMRHIHMVWTRGTGRSPGPDERREARSATTAKGLIESAG